MDALKIGMISIISIAQSFLIRIRVSSRRLHHAYRSASSDFNCDADPRRIQSAEESREDAENHGFEQKD